MLALKQPYGIWADEFVKVKITRQGVMPSYEFTDDLLDLFGTYRPAIPKIYCCLKYSGQYECNLQQDWFKSIPNIVRWCFRAVGMTLTIEAVKSDEFEEAELIEQFNAPIDPKAMATFLNQTYDRRGGDTDFTLWLKKQFKLAMAQGTHAL